MIFKTILNNVTGIPAIGKAINEINSLKLNATNITGYATAISGLSLKQAELVLSTKGLNTVQQEAILTEAGLLSTTGKLTTAELNAILVNKKRTKDQAEALLIKTGLITAETTEATATNVVTAAKLKELVQTKALTQAEANLIAAKSGVTLASQKESASILASLGTKIKGAGTALKGLGTGILTIASAHPVIAGVTAAIALCGGAALVNKVKQEKAAKAIKEAYEEAKSAIDEINNTYSTNTSQTKEIAKEYAELAQGVDLLTNKNKNLSTEKYERFLELSSQLSKLYPSLTKNFDENGIAILDLSGDVDTIVGSLDDLIDRQRALANQEIVKQMPDLFAGYSNNVSNYKEQVENAEKTKEDIQEAYDFLKTRTARVFDINGVVKTKAEFDKNLYYTIDNYTDALKALGISFKDSIIEGTTNHLIEMSDGSNFPNLSELHDIYTSAYNKAKDDISFAKQQLESETSSINQYLNTWLQTEFSYNQIEDNGMQKAIQEMLFNFDWDTLPEGIDKNDWDAVSEYLRRNILFAINNVQDNPEISKALSEIFSNQELTPDEKANYLKQITDYFGEDNAVTISLKPVIDETNTLQQQYENAIQSANDKFKGEDLTSFFEENSINTQEEINRWNECANSCNTATEAKKKYLETDVGNETPVLSWTDNQNEQLNKFQKELQTIQNAIKSIEDGSLTPNSFETLDLIQELGLTADVATSSVEGLKRELNEAAQTRFNQVLSVFEEMKKSGNINESQFNSLVSLFENVKNEIIDFSQELNKSFSGLNNISLNDVIQELNEISSSFSSLSNAYTAFKDSDSKITIDNLSSIKDVFGDLDSYEDFVSVVTKTESTTKEIQQAFDSLSTEYIYHSGILDGLTKSKKDLYIQSLKDIGIKNAEEVVLKALSLEYGTLADAQDYCAKVGKDLSEITYQELYQLQSVYGVTQEAISGIAAYAIQKQFSNSNPLDTQADIENLITLAQYAGIACDSLKYYNELKNDSRYAGASGIDAALNASKNSILDKIQDKMIKVKTSVSYDGEVNSNKNSKANTKNKEFASEIDWASNSIENLRTSIEKLNLELEKDNSYKKQLEFIDNLIDKESKLATLKKRAASTYKAEYQNSIKGLDKKYINAITSKTKINIEDFKGDSGEKLYNKVTNAQDAWRKYQESLQDYNEQVTVVAETQKKKYETEQSSISDRISRRANSKADEENRIDLKELRGQTLTKKDYTKLLTYNKNDLQDYNKQLELAVKYRNQIKKSTGVNSSAYKEADDEVQEIQNSIKETKEEQIELNRTILQLPVQKYEDAKDALENQLKVVQKQKNALEQSINASSNLVQEQIDYYNQLKTVTEETYDAQIKAIQKEKDALTETNDERERQITLEQAQIAFEQARTQKTSKIYREGKGFVFEADVQAIKDTQKELDDVKFNIKIASYDSEISAIEKAKESAISALDKQISSLEEYKNMIDEIETKFQKSLELTTLISKYGKDFVDSIQNGDLSVINTFRDEYNTLAEQENLLNEKIDAYDEAINKISLIAEQWNGNATTISNAQKQIEKVVSNTTKEFKAIDTRNEKAKEISTTWEQTTQDLKESLELITNTHTLEKDNESLVLEERLNNLKNFAEKAKEYLSEITDAISKAENLQTTITTTTVNTNSTSNGKVGKKHDGLKSGYVSKKLNTTEEKDALSTLSLNKLKDNEVLKVLEIDEAVLTKVQRQNLMDNIQSIAGIPLYQTFKSPNFNLSPRTSSVEKKQDINFNINMHEVNNVKSFVEDFERQMPAIVLQELSKPDVY